MTPLHQTSSAGSGALSSGGNLQTQMYLRGAGLLAAVIVLFWIPLRQLVSLSLSDNRYSHLILIPLISGFFFYREHDSIFAGLTRPPRLALPVLIGSLALYALLAFHLLPPSENYGLTARVALMVVAGAAGFSLCYGAKALKAARFPLLLLLLLVPVPFNLMDWIVTSLQRGSADVTYFFFKMADVPMFRQGVTFELPGIGIEIAKECSSIHSGWALFITGLLVAHLFLASVWTKTFLSILTVPIAILTNAVRIVTLWFLGTKVDPGFLTGPLHHQGGILFSLISLSILVSCLFLFRKMEQT